MKIRLNLDSIALLLFCLDSIAGASAPLNSEQWYEIEKKLRTSSLKTPSRLFGMKKEALVQLLDVEDYLADQMIERTAHYDKLLYALHHLQNEGISLTTIYEDDYPDILKQSLKRRAPLFIYYVGDLSKLKRMVSIVGIHSDDKPLQSIINSFLDKLLDEDYTLVSSMSKGVEQYALRRYLKKGGKVICFISDHMFERMNQYKNEIREGRMVLLSGVDPYSYFDVTNALDDNIYVCGLSQYQFVVASHVNSGATWFTSIQNLHYHWTTPLVYEDVDYSGNMHLLERGAICLSKRDITSSLTLDQIVEAYQKEDKQEKKEIDQISIYDFIEA